MKLYKHSSPALSRYIWGLAPWLIQEGSGCLAVGGYSVGHRASVVDGFAVLFPFSLRTTRRLR